MAELKDGDSSHLTTETPSIADNQNQSIEGSVKKKRRRGKSKRKVTKPFMKLSWHERRKYEKAQRNNRFRKIVMTKTHAPFNNNQFLMEIHKPEPENNFQLRPPSARTRDSSFSVDSEENYFYSLPENEEEYLTKEFSSVYEDAQSERLSNMTKDDLIQEYLILEAKYDNLVKKSERAKSSKLNEDDQVNYLDNSVTDKDSMITDASGISIESSVTDEPSVDDILLRLKEQEDQIHELQIANEKLRLENEHLRQKSSSSEDSESDSSSTSACESSSERSTSPVKNHTQISDNSLNNNPLVNGHNGVSDEADEVVPLVNGFHNDNDPVSHI